VHQELSILALIKGPERYIYVFDDASRDRLLDAIRNQAADPAVSLTWFDAAVLCQRARQPGLEAADSTTAPRERS
jgi:hypothetical protein